MASVTLKGSGVGGKRIGGGGGLKTFNCAIARCLLFASYTEYIIQALGNNEDKGQNKAHQQSNKKVSNIPKYYKATCIVMYALVYRSMHHLMQ